MWPFNKNQSPVPARLLEDAMDELGLVRLNDMNGAIEAAIQKHLDPSSLDGLEDDQSGHCQDERALPQRTVGVHLFQYHC